VRRNRHALLLSQAEGPLARLLTLRVPSEAGWYAKSVAFWDSAFDLYIGYLRAERGLAANTVNAYGEDLARYFEFLKRRRIKALQAVRQSHVAEHLEQLAQAGLSPRSRARHLAALRGFHRFLVDDGLLTEDATAELETPKRGRSLPEFLTHQEVERLVSAPQPTTPEGIRDRAMLELLYATGLRVTELVSLSVNDLQLTAGHLLARGKGSKERLVPVGAQAIEAVREYLETGRPELLKGKGARALFDGLPSPARAFGSFSSATGERPAFQTPACHPTSCGTPSPPILSKAGQTFEPCRRCWATRTWPLLKSTPTWTGRVYGPSTISTTPGHPYRAAPEGRETRSFQSEGISD